jgi:hypothetical protein
LRRSASEGIESFGLVLTAGDEHAEAREERQPGKSRVLRWNVAYAARRASTSG